MDTIRPQTASRRLPQVGDSRRGARLAAEARAAGASERQCSQAAHLGFTLDLGYRLLDAWPGHDAARFCGAATAWARLLRLGVEGLHRATRGNPAFARFWSIVADESQQVLAWAQQVRHPS
jgi:hypothetical protein